MSNDIPNDREMESRTRPGRWPAPVIALRELRTNLRGSIVAMEAALKALEPIEGEPGVHHLVTALRVGSGRRGGASFGTTAAIVKMLDELLGEESS